MKDQIQDREGDIIFSLGAIFFELFTGRILENYFDDFFQISFADALPKFPKVRKVTWLIDVDSKNRIYPRL